MYTIRCCEYVQYGWYNIRRVDVFNSSSRVDPPRQRMDEAKSLLFGCYLCRQVGTFKVVSARRGTVWTAFAF